HHLSVSRLHVVQTSKELLMAYVDGYLFQRFSGSCVKKASIRRIGVPSRERHLTRPWITRIYGSLYHEQPEILCLFLEGDSHGTPWLLGIRAKGLSLAY
ncbi:MAG TPA: hypothetical protein VED24_03410, partial [Candidatus Acidoferrum sp.]|nr:hypothetical protein [Candidatus Acidoferrum sp.]